MAGPPRERADGPPSPERAWDYLLTILARRMYTTAELAEKLRRRGVPEEQARELVDRLVELRLVDDATYAAMYVDSRATARGRLGLGRELARKGVPRALIDAQLSELTPDAQRAAAAALLRKNEWRYRPAAGTAVGPELLRARAKAFAFLARRGFTVDAAQGALEDVGWFAGDD